MSLIGAGLRRSKVNKNKALLINIRGHKRKKRMVIYAKNNQENGRKRKEGNRN